MKREPLHSSSLLDAVESFAHSGSGGDAALQREYPELVAALWALVPESNGLAIVDQLVTRQEGGGWRVGSDCNLASPWVVVQALRSRGVLRRPEVNKC